MKKSFSSSGPFSFGPESIITEVMKNLRRGQELIITPAQAGGSSSAKERFSVICSGEPFFDGSKIELRYTTPLSWEYTYKIGPQETELESLGNEGWELCAIASRSDGELWVFKRPKIAKGG
jgi:hypothetical protein